jgi:hypothetical protein
VSADRGHIARIATRDGKLYVAKVALEPGWVHLSEARRLARHGDGYAQTGAGTLTLPARDVRSIRWHQQP